MAVQSFIIQAPGNIRLTDTYGYTEVPYLFVYHVSPFLVSLQHVRRGGVVRNKGTAPLFLSLLFCVNILAFSPFLFSRSILPFFSFFLFISLSFSLFFSLFFSPIIFILSNCLSFFLFFSLFLSFLSFCSFFVLSFFLFSLSFFSLFLFFLPILLFFSLYSVFLFSLSILSSYSSIFSLYSVFLFSLSIILSFPLSILLFFSFFLIVSQRNIRHLEASKALSYKTLYDLH
jgi:hypothetical protein